MPWVKIPAEHHPILIAALPRDPRVTTVKMFGGIGAMVNGNMFGGLFARSAIVRLGDQDRATALALDGAALFDPMGNGRVMKDTVVLPEPVMDEPAELRDWFRRAYVATLPPKSRKSGAKKPAAKKPAAKKPAVKKPAAKQPAATRRAKPKKH